MTNSSQPGASVHVLIIGAGFGGLGLAIQLQKAGIQDFLILEKGSDVGGTWRDNSYPGAACDVPSHLYSFSFEPKADWSRKFAPQAEIFAYQRHTGATVQQVMRTRAIFSFAWVGGPPLAAFLMGSSATGRSSGPSRAWACSDSG